MPTQWKKVYTQWQQINKGVVKYYAEKLSDKVMGLPIHPNLTENEQNLIVNALQN